MGRGDDLETRKTGNLEHLPKGFPDDFAEGRLILFILPILKILSL
jgi:hypothetical protein